MNATNVILYNNIIQTDSVAFQIFFFFFQIFNQQDLPVSLEQINFTHKLCKSNLVNTVIQSWKWKCNRLSDTALA